MLELGPLGRGLPYILSQWTALGEIVLQCLEKGEGISENKPFNYSVEIYFQEHKTLVWSQTFLLQQLDAK